MTHEELETIRHSGRNGPHRTDEATLWEQREQLLREVGDLRQLASDAADVIRRSDPEYVTSHDAVMATNEELDDILARLEEIDL